MQIADVHVRMLHTNTMARGVVFMPWLDAIVLLKVHIHVGAYVVVSLLCQDLEDENVSLRSKLSHSRALCAALTARLNALGQSVDSLLQQNN